MPCIIFTYLNEILIVQVVIDIFSLVLEVPSKQVSGPLFEKKKKEKRKRRGKKERHC